MKKVVETKEELKNKIAVLEGKLQEQEGRDEWRRRQLSELLGSFTYEGSSIYHRSYDASVKVQTWMGISFLIGGLKARAKATETEMTKEALENDNATLRNKIAELEAKLAK